MLTTAPRRKQATILITGLISICRSNYYVEIMSKTYIFHLLKKLFIIIYKAFRETSVR